MSMYITRIELNNIRCFKTKIVEFNGKRVSKLFCGDNGEGKSTFLRAIAIGLCDQASAAALHRELPGDFVRANQDEPGTIDIELADRGKRYGIVTTLTTLPAFEEITQYVTINRKRSNSRDFPWKKIFVSGYGAGIRAAGSSDFRDYVSVDAVYPLFRYDVPLQNPELAFRRITTKPKLHKTKLTPAKYSDRISKHLKKVLVHVLDLLPDDDIELTETGLDLVRDGNRFELNSQGDGHKAMSTLILDLLSWWMIYVKLNKKSFLDRMVVRGIVLIDEVEQHLHPRWQIKIMKLLRDTFPRVQFIVATHSPLVISGSDKIDVHQISEKVQDPISTYGWLAEDVYGWMGLSGSRAPEFYSNTVAEHRRLDMKRLRGKISAVESRKLNSLRKRLNNLPAEDPVRLIAEISNIRERLQQIRKAKKR